MSQTRLRRQNRRRLLRSLVRNGPTPRSLIADDLQLTQAAVSRLVRELIDAGVLEDGEKLPTEGRPGRQHIRVRFASGGLYVVGIGFEAFSQSVVVADLNGNIVCSQDLGISDFHDVPTVCDNVSDAIGKLLQQCSIGPDRVIGVGLAVVGIVDRENGRVIRSGHLGWSDTPIALELEKRTGLPVVVDNLLHSTNLAEHSFGMSRGHDQVLLIRTSLSVGASLLVDHKIVRGAHSLAGQIAHAPVSGASQRCSCGAAGCLETVASGRAAIARFDGNSFSAYATQDISVLSDRLSQILKLADNGDPDAHRAVVECGRALGRALEWPLLTMDPECVLLSGPVARHPSYVQGMRKGLAEHRTDLRFFERPLLVGQIPIRQVASYLAMMEFVMARDLDLDRLRLEQSPDGPDPDNRKQRKIRLVAG